MQLDLIGRVSYLNDLELKKKSSTFLKNDLSKVENVEKYKKDYAMFIEQVNDLGKSNLAKYIIHRKLILDLLNNYLNSISDRFQE